MAAAILAAAALTATPAPPPRDDRLNIVVILTDDQSFDTLPSDPPALPWLQSQIRDQDGHWLWFPNAFIETPLCCPSRATILSGLYSRHTHVRTNDDGERFDETQTIATWLHDAGYFTGLIGKYLNRYPFGRGPYIPPGWDRWVVKRNTAATTTYSNFGFVDQGVALQTSDAAATYATDLFADHAVDFLRTAPDDRPFFLYFATSAPHPPWTPPPRHAGAFSGVPLPAAPSVGERNLSDKPMWVRKLRRVAAAERAEFLVDRRHEAETLLAVDDAVERIVGQLAADGDLDRTVIFFLTDNGFSFGQHRIRAKRCPYEECIRTPFAARVPGAGAQDLPGLISNVDLAPTIADLAGVQPGQPVDGRSFAPALLGERWRSPAGVFLEWAGDGEIPPWQGVRTGDFAYIESADGTVELYDITGAIGAADPFELRSRSADPHYRGAVRRLAALLRALRSRPPGRR
ncbi:MAG: sulfatase family protein [Actinomycetota bacterium]